MGFEKKSGFSKKKEVLEKSGLRPGFAGGGCCLSYNFGDAKMVGTDFQQVVENKKGAKKMTPLRLDAMPAVISGLRLSWCIHASRRLRSRPIYDLPGLFRMAVI